MKMKWIKALCLAAILSGAPVNVFGAQAAEPSGGSGEATLSMADSLARAGKLDRAIAIIEEVLAREPANTDGRLLYARTLSWKGEYERAISVYEDVVRQKPENAEAHAGYARVLSWKGEYSRSIEEYRKALAIEPGSIEARMGLARTLWWKGDDNAALNELSTILSIDPANGDALSLERRLRALRGPLLKALYSNSSDSDTNRLASYRLSFSDTFGLPGHRFEAGYRRFDASSAGRSATAHFLDLKDSIRLSGKSVLTPRLSLVSLDSDLSNTAYLAGGLSFYAPVMKSAGVSLSYSRYPLVDTVTLIENNIRVSEAAAALTHDMRRATLSASAVSASYSDGNSRYDLSGGISVNVLKSPNVVAGFVSEYRDFSERKANGYYNPPHIFSNSVYLEVSDRFRQDFLYRAKATLGNQSREGTSDLAGSFQAGLEWEATRDLSVEALYKYSRSALESASGFSFEEFRAGVNYLF
ncbi:MAG: tetratricopeptide repeat protein [Deltaproteobacteria bacterium]|nr:tetratricopeptide repeat protein [Deltaproteobacteria bacterium]